jgi:hypothetical protein
MNNELQSIMVMEMAASFCNTSMTEMTTSQFREWLR